MTKNAVPDIVITSALPYANGPIHIGHLVEYIQTDIFVRFLKLSGKRAVYLCADDTHGAPIEINAGKQGVTPEAFIARYHAEHQADFARYHIAFDSYYSTNSDENRHFAEAIYAALKGKGDIVEKELELTYCEHDKRFLPDRYVKGTCPSCGAADQYGDVCEKCNAAYQTVDLVRPYCALCGNPPVRRRSTHLFFRLSAHADWLKGWLEGNANLQPEIRNQILAWIEKGLEDWCISRDGPYFGFRIPGSDKFFYVWLDAPIGYISSLANYLGKDVALAERAWNGAEIRHFIGKDIIYFHLLFWPAVLHAAGWKVPDDIVVHGFLTVDGEKMSKSRGTFLTAEEFAVKVPDVEFLRFYYAANLSHAMTDIDLNLHDFTERVNKELVSNVANLVYRALSFTEKNYGGKLGARATDARAVALERAVAEKAALVLGHYASYEFRKAVQELLAIADLGNQYFQACEPWKNKESSLPVLTTCINLVKDLSILFAPILPAFSAKVQAQLGLPSGLLFSDVGRPVEDHALGSPAIIWTKMEPLLFGAPKDAGKKEGVVGAAGSRIPAETARTGAEPVSGAKTVSSAPIAVDPSILDLIVAKIVAVERHPKAEKLFIETLDDGSGTERVIVSGLVPYYAAEALVGKRIVLVNNLKPAKLRGVLSQGMLLAADDGKGVVEVLSLEAAPGTPVLIEGFEQGKKEISIDEFFSLTFTVTDHIVRCEGRKLLVDGKGLSTTRVSDGKVA